MVDGGMKCVKYLLFAFNFVFFLIGLLLIIVGGVVLAKVRNYQEISGVTSGPVFVLVVGGIILIVAFFGCCGAAKENSCMLGTFAALIGIIFALEFIAAIVAFAFRNKTNETIHSTLNQTANNYVNKNDTSFWDTMQKDFQCCGIDNATTWSIYHSNLPDSCCVIPTVGCGKNGYSNMTDANKFYQPGCLTKLETSLKEKMLIVAGVALGLAFIELLGIVFACCLCQAIRKDYNVV